MLVLWLSRWCNGKHACLEFGMLLIYCVLWLSHWCNGKHACLECGMLLIYCFLWLSRWCNGKPRVWNVVGSLSVAVKPKALT